MSTLVIDNFKGSYTTYLYGDINSGRSYEGNSSGANPFIKPGQLTWSANPVQIDPNGAVITDLIMAAKERVENGILYEYAIGHTGRLYKIQVNDPTTFNPDYDNPVLLTTLIINTPTFTRGASMDFCGTPEQIFIGHDKGITTVHYDGTAEAFLGVLGSYTQTVPRPLKQFIGKLYAGNGNNLAEIDISGTGTVNTYTKLSPAFPAGTQVRDIDLSTDGNYLETVVSRLALFDITSAAQDTSQTANSESYIVKWNGTDLGATAVTTFPSFALSANILFQNYQYTFGSDQFGSAIFDPAEKIISTTESSQQMPNAVASTGNLLLAMSSLHYNGVMEADLIAWGSNDFEVGHPPGYWDIMFLNSKAPETDIIRVPLMTTISNTGYGSSSNGYANNNIFGTSKIYFSTLETSSAPTTKYRFYKWTINTSPIQSPVVTNASTGGYYQTQIQMFSKKVTISQVRIYGEPWIANNAFQIDLVGTASNPISGGTKVFTAQNTDAVAPMYIGTDYAWWDPTIAPSYAVGIGITNKGTINHTINKIEIDYENAGK